jgi:glycerophosphoryl diester phosphodiesterase
MRRFALLTGLCLVAVAPVPASALEIHAHRGGPLATVGGEVVPALPEESMRAFRDAHKHGYVIELDAKLTSDGVPVVIHDATLDRTTDCSGRVVDHAVAQVTKCRIDVLGTGAVTAPIERPRDRVPTLATVLDWAAASGARLNLEIKNIPTENDFDPGRGFAETIVAALEQSGIARDRALVQSFWPPNLDVAKERGWRTALLTLNAMNEGAPTFATANGYDVLSPEWPLNEGFTTRALGKPVVPWTLNAEADIRAAVGAGVDGIISDNPGLVRAVAGG